MSALHGGQQKGSVAAFSKMTVGSNHGVVVLNGPQAVIEQPVGVLGEGKAVVRVVVAAGGKGVDMSGIYDGAGIEGDEPVAGQGAGVVIGRNDADPEPSFPSTLHSFRVDGQIGSDRTIRWGSGFTRQCPEGNLFVRFEVGADDECPGLCPECGIIDRGEEFRGKTNECRQVAVF